MKRDNIIVYRVFKVCQLLLLIIFFITFFIYLKTDPILGNSIYTNTKLMTIVVFLWAFMIFSFLAIVIDFIQIEKSLIYTDDLNRIAYRDNLTGIPNRISCDIIFQKYEDLEDISGISVALISITNLAIINESLGRDRGNLLIQEFAVQFERVAAEYGFFGRNSGNEFLVVIEDCDEVKMDEFLNKLSVTMKEYNDSVEHMPVTYKTATVSSSELANPTFSDMITRLYNKKG